jgi:hypothetical protein
MANNELLKIEAEQQGRWEAAKAFESDAPTGEE